MMKFQFRAEWVFVALLVTVARATPQVVKSPQLSADQPASKQPALTAESTERSSPQEYTLQSGDELDIRVYDLPQLSAVVAVRPDGKISLPLQNDIEASGITARQLVQRITAGYEKEFRNPRVTVIVRSFSSENVYVGGEVAQPGFIPLKGEMTVIQAVFRAGGFKETARVDEVMLLRNDGKGDPVVTKLMLKQVLKGQPDLPLQAFDVVFVPKTKIARTDKFIDQYIRQLLPVSGSYGFSYVFGRFIP